MTTTSASGTLFGAVLALAFCSTGCQDASVPQGVTVTGRVVENGAPLPAPRADAGIGLVQLELRPVAGAGGDGAWQVTSADAEGKFTLVGEGAGIPAGSYDVVLSKSELDGSDSLAKKFGPGRTPIRLQIPADASTHDVGDIDVAKY